MGCEKSEIFAFAYGGIPTRYCKAFKREFPVAHRGLRALVGRKRGNNGEVWRAITRIESLVFEKILNELHRSGFDALRNHDEIICKKQEAANYARRRYHEILNSSEVDEEAYELLHFV